MDPEAVHAKMQKTGETEGVLFNTLFEVSDSIEAQLTEEQRTKLAELKQTSQRRAAGKEQTVLVGAGYGVHPGTPSFDSFLDQTGRLGLTAEQIVALVAAKNETRKTFLIEQAKLKEAELKLLTLLRDQNAGTLASDDKLAAAARDLEEIRSRITQSKALGYLKAQQLLTPEQRQRGHPQPTLEDGRSPPFSRYMYVYDACRPAVGVRR
ncbi:MAG TPA: hypothetical protein VNK46_11125 [Nitrospiraceae bacterium]|nr:hypothetical protein [Nitrospiraceae bacterium]